VFLNHRPKYLSKAPRLTDKVRKIVPIGDVSLWWLCVGFSDVLAWLGLEASGFGLALSGFGFQNP